MKKFGEFVVSAFVAGLLVVVPLYVTILLLLKAMQSVVAFVRPFVMLRVCSHFRRSRSRDRG